MESTEEVLGKTASGFDKMVASVCFVFDKREVDSEGDL